MVPGHIQQLTTQPGADLQPGVMVVHHQMGKDQLAVFPADRQRCTDLHERSGGLRRLDQHQDPMSCGGPELGTIASAMSRCT